MVRAISAILVLTIVVVAGAEHAAPHGALLVLLAVGTPPALVVDILVFVGPRDRPFRDPLAAHDESPDRTGHDDP